MGVREGGQGSVRVSEGSVGVKGECGCHGRERMCGACLAVVHGRGGEVERRRDEGGCESNLRVNNNECG